MQNRYRQVREDFGWSCAQMEGKMAAILMINVPYAGHTNPTLPLVEALFLRTKPMLHHKKSRIKR